MEEDLKIEEQPQSIKTVENAEGSSEAVQDVEPSTSEAERGVPVGKFKNVEDLMTAYNNLQAEFTRNCQRLSVLEKEKTDEPKQDVASLDLFLSKNQEAVLYAEELKSRVEQDESLQKEKDPYGMAWASLLYEKLASPNLSKEPLVKNLILKDEELKNLVIENYVEQIKKQNIPVVM
ncbi:MAG: hypothetical protein IJX25_00720, partial [Clostridia bacterium]|nr:hypothetical protein [Clostridia bacterium]